MGASNDGLKNRKSLGGDQPQMIGVTAIKPPEYHGLEAVKMFIYDSNTGKVLSRTPMSWFLITVFYVIYYFFLACFWYGMLTIFFQLIPEDRPKYTLKSSIIGDNPGLGIRPGQNSSMVGNSIFDLTADASDINTREYADRMRFFMEQYKDLTGTKACSDGDYNKDASETSCQFDLELLGECSQYPFGYDLEGGKDKIEPCVFIKVNRIIDWVPQEFTDEDLETDESMPDNVKSLVRNDRKQVYVDCTGEFPADQEAVEGHLTYFPSNQGVSFKYFPYVASGTQNLRNFHQPVVAVKFGSGIPGGQFIHVECKLWSKNIIHVRKEQIGMTRFEMYIH